jgi:hypothetical protein
MASQPATAAARQFDPLEQETISRVAWRLLPVLESPGFAQSFGSGGEAEGLHFVGVLSFDDEFGEDVVLVSIEEKFGQPLA